IRPVAVDVSYIETRMAVVRPVVRCRRGAVAGDGDGAAVVHAECPLGDVVVVGTPVGHLAAGVFVPPAELIMAALLDERCFRRRPLPEVPVEALGRLFHRERTADGVVSDKRGDLPDAADAA